MALALAEETTDPVAAIIHELEAAHWRPDPALLRRAVTRADQLVPAVTELVEKAADGVCLLLKQERLLFWGIHILATARCTALYRPLLRLIRLDREEHLDHLLGDALTETLPRILISVFDGDAAPLFELCAQRTADGFLRWGLFEAIARLTFDGMIPQPVTVEFLDRFERQQMADAGDAAWEGWQDAIVHLAVEELHDRVRATWKDKRNPCAPGDQEFIEELLARARALPPGDSSLLTGRLRTPIDDPVKALSWTAQEEHERAKPDKSPFGPDPAADVALDEREVGWLTRFLNTAKVPAAAMIMEQIDGFFCALIAGPSPPPEDYMTVIWDTSDDPDADGGPSYDSTEQAEYVAGLLARHWSAITQRLEHGYPHEPLMNRWPDEFEARYWAAGFIRGVAMRAQAWGPRSSDDFVGAFLNMMVTLGASEDALNDGDGVVDSDMREKLVDSPADQSAADASSLARTPRPVPAAHRHPLRGPQSRPQRALSLRQRQEVQTVLRIAHDFAQLSGAVRSYPPLRQ